MSGGGSGATTSTSYNTNVPEYAQPYVMQMLGQAQSLTNPNTNPYQPYQGQQVADISPLQQQAYQNLGQMNVAGQTGIASNMAAAAGANAMGGVSDPNKQYYNSNALQNVNAPQLNMYQMGGPQQVRTQNYTGNNVNQYMSPYMQDVVDQQKREAIADYGRSIPGMQAGASAAGGLGGTRQALVQSEANRNLQNNLQNIQATGSQAAFQNAQQQFNAQQQANLQAQQANQQAGLTTGQANLNAALGVQQLGAGQSLQAQQANQQAALQNAGQAAQYGLSADQLYGQTYNQGLANLLNASNQMGSLGQQQYNQQAGITQAQLTAGQQQQQQKQQLLNTAYQDYLNQLNYPYKQLGFMSDLIHGTAAQNTTSGSALYQAPANTTGQIAGLGLGLGSLFGSGLFGSTTGG